MAARMSTLSLGFVTTLLAGCMGSDLGPGPQALESALQRSEDHQAMASRATDVAALHRETQAYERDMEGFMADMDEACDDMMSATNESRRAQMRELEADTVRARAAVDQHVMRIMKSNDLAEMRRECDDHVWELGNMFDTMRGTMARGGMMGGGMMSGGMMH